MSVESSVISVPGPNSLQDGHFTSDREGELLRYLKGSKCKDAPEDEIKLFISYCQAAAIDPTSDAAYLVGYYSEKLKKKIWNIIPGIGKFRIQAARSGQCMGVDAPEYGSLMQDNGKNVPEFCRVTVKKLIHGKFSDHIASYVGEARWSDFGKFRKFNPMWFESPFNQLAKCAEAQALRKAFPELFGGQYTFEEVQDRLLRDEQPEQQLERPSNVVERLKNKRKVIEKVEMGSLGIVEVVELSGDDASYSDIEKPVKEVDPMLLGLFNMMKDSKKSVSDRVNEFMLKQGFNVGDLNNDNLRTLIKKIVSTFPEIKLQLSKDKREIVERIEMEVKK